MMEALEKIEENTVNELSNLESIIEDIKNVARRMSEILTKMDKLKKTKKKIIRAIVPMIVSRNPVTNKTISTYAKPNKLNNLLISFFKLDSNVPLSIMDIHIKFNEYILLNNLRDHQNRYKINPNKELIELFELKEGDHLNFLNLTHYIKSAVRRKSV